jgi:hypothetical protein
MAGHFLRGLFLYDEALVLVRCERNTVVLPIKHYENQARAGMSAIDSTKMRASWIVCVAVLLSIGQAARAEQFSRNVQAGVLTTMYTYHSWNAGDCSSKSGIVRVLTKPQHGTLSHTDDVSAPSRNRFRPDDPCIGKPMNGFRVQYISAPGYRGTDSFVVEVLFPGRPRIVDSYSVIVN